MKKNWKEICFMLPSVAAGIAALAGLRMNIPVFSPITYPPEEMIRKTGEYSVTDEKTGKETEKYPVTDEEMKKREESDISDRETKERILSEKDKDSSENKLQKMGYSKSNTWKDGIYTGSGTGFGGPVKIRVTIKDGKITDIQILSGTGETPSYLDQAKGVIPRMIAAQSPDVDMVSGATYSSNGIRSAVIQALQQAENIQSVRVETLPAKDTGVTKPKKVTLPVPGRQPGGTVKDGVYTVSAACEPDERNAFAVYTLTADVTFQDGRCISIANFTSTDESNRSFYRKAADGTGNAVGIVGQILERQSASGLDAVSGATCSSKTIQNLYQKALQQAAGKSQKGAASSKPSKQTPAQPSSDPSEPTSDRPSSSSSKQTPVQTSEDTQVPALVIPSADPPAQTPISMPSIIPVQPGNAAGSHMQIKDGTYTASAMVTADEWEEFDDYTLTADVTFSGGKLTAITNLVPADVTNQGYCDSAANGYGTKKGIIQQLIDRQDSQVDAVSGATCSSSALIQIYQNAWEMASQEGQE